MKKKYCTDCGSVLTGSKCNDCGWTEPVSSIRYCVRCEKQIGGYWRHLAFGYCCESCLKPFELDWHDQLINQYMKDNPIGVTHSREEHAGYMEIVKAWQKIKDIDRDKLRQQKKRDIEEKYRIEVERENELLSEAERCAMV